MNSDSRPEDRIHHRSQQANSCEERRIADDIRVAINDIILRCEAITLPIEEIRIRNKDAMIDVDRVIKRIIEDREKGHESSGGIGE